MERPYDREQEVICLWSSEADDDDNAITVLEFLGKTQYENVFCPDTHKDGLEVWPGVETS